MQLSLIRELLIDFFYATYLRYRVFSSISLPSTFPTENSSPAASAEDEANAIGEMPLDPLRMPICS